MIKRDRPLTRSSRKRICECGGKLKFLCVGEDMLPHTLCVKCGKEHIGLSGTKVANE